MDVDVQSLTDEFQTSKKFLPRRSDQATMATTRAGIILEKGEFFLEYPNTGPGTKGLYRIKIGDGKSKYKDLPYAFGDISEDPLVLKEDSIKYIDFETAMKEIKNGASVSQVVLNIKAALKFIKEELDEHTSDADIHITPEERIQWNNVSIPQLAKGGLDQLRSVGTRYYGNASNSLANKPSGVDAFALTVDKGGEGYLVQQLTETNGLHPGRQWVRTFNSNTNHWTDWVQVYSHAYTQLHTNSSSANAKVADGNVTFGLISSDIPANNIGIKGDKKGVKVEANGDNITISGEYKLSVETNMTNGKADGFKMKLVDINGNTQTITFRGLDSTLVRADSNTEVAFQTNMEIDASKIVSGVIDINRIPKGALERLVKVPNIATMYALNADQVQAGDTVFVVDQEVMYMVVDTNNLKNANGYQIYNGYQSKYFDGGYEG